MTAKNEPKSTGSPMDAFTSFWTEYFSKMAPQAPPASAPLQSDFVKQMQQSFFEAMARSFTDFMRTEQFLQIMKQTMDNALLFRQQMNKFLTSTAHGLGQATLEDTNHIVEAIHNVEDRMNEKLGALQSRLDSVERTLVKGRREDDGAESAKRAPLSPNPGKPG